MVAPAALAPRAVASSPSGWVSLCEDVGARQNGEAMLLPKQRYARVQVRSIYENPSFEANPLVGFLDSIAV